MPKVTLAYDWQSPEGVKNADSTVDVDEATAVDLLNKGWARPADEAPRKGGK